MPNLLLCMILQQALMLPAAVAKSSAAPPTGLRSESVIIRLVEQDRIVYEKNADVQRPIASVTKLLSGLLLHQASPAGDLLLTISEEDKDRQKWSRSHLRVGLTFTWDSLMLAALGASDNRAMYAAVRGTGIPREQFVVNMNQFAAQLGMRNSRFTDPAGIDPGNQSTARDLLHLLAAAARNPAVSSYTRPALIELVSVQPRRTIVLPNPDRLARSSRWQCIVGKTGYTIEAGRNLVVRAMIAGEPVDMVFLGSREMASVFGDASRVRDWLSARLASGAFAPPTPAAATTAATPITTVDIPFNVINPNPPTLNSCTSVR